jgi:signal transduction histidine kinase
LISCVLIAQGIVTNNLTAVTELQSRHLERDSILSMARLSRIALDAAQAQRLVDEHIRASDPAVWASIEQRLNRVLQDIHQESQAYAPLVELPDETSDWLKAHVSLNRFSATVDSALAFSRQDLDAQAYAAWNDSDADYASLQSTLTNLIAVNQKNALDATEEIKQAEQKTRDVNDAVRYVALAGVLLLGLWLSYAVLTFERQRRESAARLAAQNRDLDAFAGRVAHDIKNALSPLHFASSLLSRHTGDPERVRDLARRIEANMRQVNQIIDSLLAFSRGSQHGERDEAASVGAVVRSVLDEVRPFALRMGATVDVDHVSEMTVACDAGLLHVVLANLMSNAVKYLEGQQERRVRLVVSREEDSCRFEVADTGPGIPKRDQSAIFEPFYRSKSAQAPGVGIGLATVRRIVDAHDGRIAVHSEEGHGSRFVLWLPLARGPESQVRAA